MALQGSDYFIVERSSTHYNILGSDILAYVQANVGTTQFNVADLTARNALSNLSLGDRVLVNDASSDATVTTGWAIYMYMGSSTWQKVAEEESLDITINDTDLSYTASPTQGIVTSSTGNNATLPAANGTNAGLMVPAQFDKLAHITVTADVNLQTIASQAHANVTLEGNANTNPLTRSNQVLGFSISQLTSAP